ncbi:MAG: GHKL domain-containing protein [Lactococcus plantarum]|nr:GHKL domain-containing protein [Lactococcus plantarum]MDN6069605.1 GHKL domain-containing protein [Lactococcus plantarum]MDN6084873.1 GHKL domain-containing protein [Lactococcus plantarum]
MNYKNDLVSGLAIYTKEVEGASESARAFYHDFTNILLSMQETISTKEVGEIRKMYAEILKKCHIGFMARRQEVGKLSHIKVLEVKSVIAAKILRAERHRISIELEIPQVITHLQVDNVDVVRLLGIMLDNAIDEVQALGSAQPVVRLAIFDKDNSRYFVVENEMRQEKLPTHLIFERGYSTKGCTRGYGLANLEKIVASYPWVSYHIQAKNYKYRIELEMRRS